MEAARLLADASRAGLVRAVTIKADAGTMTLRELAYLAAVFAVVLKWDAVITSLSKMLTDFKKIIPADYVDAHHRISQGSQISLLARTRTERDLASFWLASQMGRR